MKFIFQKLLNFILKLKKEHVFLFYSLIISFILSFLPCLYCIITFFEDKHYSFIFFIPFLLVLLTTYIAIYLYKYLPKITKILTLLINLFIIIFIQIFVGIYVLAFMVLINNDYMRDKPEFYEEVLTYFPEEKVAHFPKHIPQNAKNVEMDADMFSFQGGQSIIIKFDADKKYIENELKKHKFKSQETKRYYVFNTLTNNGRIKIDDFTFYVISGNFGQFGRNYGIGVNKNFDKIIYYYSNPD